MKLLKATRYVLTTLVFAMLTLNSAWGVAPKACNDVLKGSVDLTAPNLPTSKIENYAITLGKGRYMAVSYSAPQDSTKPTLLFMPGIYRGFLLTDPAFQALISMGYGVSSMTFSTQPLSIACLPEGEKPEFQTRSFSTDDLRREVNEVALHLTKAKKAGVVIPVSLSFSGVFTDEMAGYQKFVDMVPMTSFTAAEPEAAQARATLEALNIFNPFKAYAVSAGMDFFYRETWRKYVAGIIKEVPSLKDNEGQMIDGYMAMSKMVEDAEWNVAKADLAMPRAFVLAEQEAPALLLSQLQAVQGFWKRGGQGWVLIVGSSGHIIPNDQPQGVAQAMRLIVESPNALQSHKFIYIDPVKGTITVSENEKADQAVAKLISMAKEKVKP